MKLWDTDVDVVSVAPEAPVNGRNDIALYYPYCAIGTKQMG